jgi:hypothetical protein
MTPLPLLTARRRAPRAAERGSLLLASLLIAMMLAGLSVGLITEGFAARANVTRSDTSLRALEVAEVGLARAELELASNLDPGGDGIGTLSGTWAGGTYQVTMVAADPMVERFTARAVGVVGNSRREIEVGLRRRSSGAFIEGLFSMNDLVFGGNSVTDAYDTRVGTYASQAVNTDAYGTYADLGGNLGSNTGFITLMGSSVTVRGDAVPGPGRSVYEHGNPVVTGDTAPREAERPVPPIPYSEFSGAAASNNNGSWNVAGKEPTWNATTMSFRGNAGSTITLDAGTYFFSNFSLQGGAILQINGDVKIYVTGTMDLTGGTLVNMTGRPQSMTVLAHPYALPSGFTPTSTSVKVAGGNQSALIVYGPQAALTLHGGSHIFGAAVARTIDVSGGVDFHYDKALDDLMKVGAARVERIYWREPNPPRR